MTVTSEDMHKQKEQRNRKEKRKLHAGVAQTEHVGLFVCMKSIRTGKSKGCC